MHRRIPLSNHLDSSLLYISETELDKDFKASYHSHPTLELLLINEGTGNLITTNRRISIKKGDLIIINSHSLHCEVSSSKCRFYSIGVNRLDANLDNNFSKKIIKLPLDKTDYDSINFLYHLIITEAENKKMHFEDIIFNAFQQIKYFIQRTYQIKFISSSKEYDNSVISSAKNIIENYFYTNININDLSHRLSISPSTLSHQFKKITGRSVIEYKHICQINEACNLLKITDMNILDIAFATGFTSSSYFSEMFKKMIKLSPKEYRLMNK